ncbi:MAG: CoA pyrophosphatase [Flavobacteriales bacterium]|nr:MAG: CoA pyrophosphatase [Flavobacteriales bacterium]|tara:strand:+ start:747 stop:1361 length:615 start_codon:yes stop_codon:yes gene_type:complete
MKLTEFLVKSPKLNEIPKPGIKSQLKMEPHGREICHTNKNNLRFAATILLFYPIKKVLHFCLIRRRAIEKNVHSDQIAFPGGEIDKSDKSSWDAALREINEEIGVKQDQVIYITKLSKVFIPVSNFIVFPFMARTTKSPAFVINKKEVDYLIEVKLSMLLSKNSIGTAKINNRKVPIFDFDGEKVWGATAMVLSEARDLILLLK